MTGASGGMVSTVTTTAGDDAGPGLPAVSVALAVRQKVRADSRVGNVRVQAPELSAVVVPSEVVPSNTCTVASSSEVPDISVIAVFCNPSTGSVMTGASGGMVSTVTTTAGDDAGPGLPAVSVALAVRL